jgi:type I restriction enzyme R subunit
MEFVKDKFTGEQLENGIIELFSGADGAVYSYVYGDHINRRHEDIFAGDDLRASLASRYASVNLTEKEVSRIVSRLELIQSTPLRSVNRETF